MAHKKQQVPQDSDIDQDDDEKKGMDDDEYTMGSQWKSSVFKVEVDDDEVKSIELSDYFNPNIGKQTRKIVYPIYILIGLAALCMIFLGLFGDEMASLISILSICTMTWVGAIVGMIGVYLWGTVEDCVDWFREQNNKFAQNIGVLTETRKQVKEVTRKVFSDVQALQEQSAALTKHLDSFEELRASLEKICGDNKDLNKMLGEINDQYNDLVTVISQNERASLLSIYYEVSMLDREGGLNEREYTKFLGRLNNKTKQLFMEYGDFATVDKDGDGNVDLKEFEAVLDEVIKAQEKLNVQHYMKGTDGRRRPGEYGD
eukprot:CAMPEP_0197040804 /NCGR_PEP_ID=MMETSP1384-20130603/17456_1 /TAXON_ID=29189 /ORGANISM="Ammonia sp." /LENGTH=315 /DNA_ID=CAMNT_0042471629 /DNA_START=50 /DNA_END=997 /DNA_ORIENTATION=-